jgi:hypothetical protein
MAPPPAPEYNSQEAHLLDVTVTLLGQMLDQIRIIRRQLQRIVDRVDPAPDQEEPGDQHDA